MRAESRRGSLRTKIVGWSFVPAAIILTAVALVTYYSYQQVTEDLVIERDEELTRLTAGELADSLRDYPGILEDAARDLHGFQDDPPALQFALRNARQRFSLFDAGVLALDHMGRVVAAEPPRPESVGQDWSGRSFFRQLVDGDDPAFSDILNDGPKGAEVIAIAVPVSNARGELVGALVGMFRLGADSVSPFYGTLLRLRLERSGAAFVVDANGRVIYATDPAQIGANLSASPVAAEVLAGRSGAVRGRSLDGRDVLASYGPVPNTSWSLLVEENWDDLTQASQSYGRFLLALLALGVLIPTVVVTIGVRHITGPIAALVDASRQVASGNFGRTVDARTGDELEELADQFNRMSAELAASYTGLEGRVESRTRELATLLGVAQAVATENARLYEAEQRRAEQFRVIAEVGQDITSILAVDAILSQAVGLIQSAFGYSHVHVGLIERDEIVFRASATPRADETCCEATPLRIGLDGFAGWVAARGEPLLAPDVSLDPRYVPGVAAAVGSALVLPLKVKGQVIGVLDVESERTHAFDENDMAVLQSLGNQLAVAIENARLYEQAVRLAALEERQKLARELHDSVSQALYGIGLGARTARTLLDRDPAKAAEPLDYVLSLAEAGLAEMRALIFELRPESLKTEGLVAALAKQSDSLRARHRLDVRTDFAPEPEIPLATKEAMYRIAQEAMHNVAKHARATRVDLCLGALDGELWLEVGDDGVGFDPLGEFPGHLGLRSMRERAERLGGAFEARSAPGGGTRIRVRVPLGDPDKAG